MDRNNDSYIKISYIQLGLMLLAQAVMFCISVAALYKMNINYHVIKNSLCGIPCYSSVFIILLLVLTCSAFLIIRNKKNRLIPYYIFGSISMILVLIILSIVGYTQRNQITPIIEQHMNDSISRYLKREDHIVNFWNDLHVKHNCCGINSFKDWLTYKELYNHLPSSCCDENYQVTEFEVCTEVSTTLRYDGCLKPFANNLEHYFIILLFLQLVLAIIQLPMIFYKITSKCFPEKLKSYMEVPSSNK